MIPFKTETIGEVGATKLRRIPYEKSTTASRRAAKRAQLKFSHVSLVYDENNEKRTATKKLSPEERLVKNMKGCGTIEERMALAKKIVASISRSLTPRGTKTTISEDDGTAPQFERVNPDPSDNGQPKATKE